MLTKAGQKPVAREYADFYSGYVSLVGNGPITEIMAVQLTETVSLLKDIPLDKSTFSYGEGKWSIAEVVGHMIDTERIMSYRALAFARGDDSEIAGMDQDQYASQAGHGKCSLSRLIDEFSAIRSATVLFFENLPSESWDRTGVASGHPVSVRALAYIIAGHELHHRKILTERYFPDFGV